jgi:hypothetical protein
MKIDYAIMGSYENPMYLDFWPIISKTWKEIFNITPVLGLICDEDSDFIEDEYGLIKKFKTIEGMDSGLQSQIIRLWLTKELTGNMVISDIDMVPLSKQYFIDQIEHFDVSKIYSMSTDNAECNNNKEFPMCYNISDSQLFAKMLDLDDTWVQFATKLHSMNFGWTTDQNYLWLKLQEYRNNNPNDVVLLNRGWSRSADRRIDRLWWSYDPNLVRSGHYIDSHLLRPYNENKEEVNKLINLLW